jgi:hypothetical protein
MNRRNHDEKRIYQERGLTAAESTLAGKMALMVVPKRVVPGVT